MIALAWLRFLRWALGGWFPVEGIVELDGEIERREGERARRRRSRRSYP